MTARPHSVFHPSDFSEASRSAFMHALAIALLRRTRLTILHSAGRQGDFPSVRDTLARWGMLTAGSERAAVSQELGVRIDRISALTDPFTASVKFLDRNPTDLLVLATEGPDGLPKWIRPSMARRLARRTQTRTLFVPNGVRGFVSAADGKVVLRRILVPVDHAPSSDDALDYARRMAASSGNGTEITVLHVGQRMPAIRMTEDPFCKWKTTLRFGGDVVEEVVKVARRRSVDLIVMATEGHRGILDAFRGSVTERVLRQAPCPLLAVPAPGAA